MSLELGFFLLIFLFNPFIATTSLEMGSENAKFETLKHFFFFFSLACERKELSSKRIALKLDVTGPENILFAGTSLHLSARKFYTLGQ